MLLWLVYDMVTIHGFYHLVYDNYGVFPMNWEYWFCWVVLVNYGCDDFEYDVHDVILSFPYETLGC